MHEGNHLTRRTGTGTIGPCCKTTWNLQPCVINIAPGTLRGQCVLPAVTPELAPSKESEKDVSRVHMDLDELEGAKTDGAALVAVLEEMWDRPDAWPIPR